jgi:NitT/TauT family transport system permease protein
MTDNGQQTRSLIRAAITLACAAAFYEMLARSGYFAPALLPRLSVVVQTLFATHADGSMIEHAIYTLYRVMFGFCLAVIVGLPLGILMARFQRIEGFFMPLVSALMPIPSFALVPLFMLWFGIGNLTTVLIVFYAATFPMLFNTWSGVRSVNPLWLRAAGAMGADENALFWKVIIPGASPFIITGMRQARLRSGRHYKRWKPAAG